MYELSECINYLLTNAHRNVFLCMKNTLSPLHITPIQYGVLRCIREYDLHMPRDIASFLAIDTSSLSGLLERLESLGYIQRSIDRENRRQIFIELTEDSLLLESQARILSDQVNDQIQSVLGDTKTAQLRELLEEISCVRLRI